MLIEKSTGEPLFEPSIYVLSEIRATNKASNTIDQVLQSIMVLQLFTDSKGIDITTRLRESKVFTLNELDELVRHCRLSVPEQLKVLAATKIVRSAQVRPGKIFRLGRQKAVPAEVGGHQAATRVRYIRNYLDWLVKYRIAAIHSTKEGERLWEDWKRCKDALNARVPRHKGRNTIGRREGLAPAVKGRLYSVVLPDSPDNPWKGEKTRVRNNVLIQLLCELGLRRGELLNIKVSDINFQSGELTVVRRADDPEDPRTDQPYAKTRDRTIPLSPALCKLIYDYIMKTRRSFAGARRHPYLIVAMRTGAPLSSSAVGDVFSDLREKYPDEFDAVTTHVLRHTWNDSFSEMMDKKNLPEVDEENMRSYLMGWSPTSKTAIHYTRRHVRLKAQRVSLEMQAKQVEDGEKDG